MVDCALRIVHSVLCVSCILYDVLYVRCRGRVCYALRVGCCVLCIAYYVVCSI